MPYTDKRLELPKTGENNKWEAHSTTRDLPKNASYLYTQAIYYCPAHGAETMEEGDSGHWFRFLAAAYDPNNSLVRCDCSYQVHDKNTYVVFRVHYREQQRRTTLDELTDDEVISILKQKDEWLNRVGRISPSRLQEENLMGGEANEISANRDELVVNALSSAITPGGMMGIYFHVRRKGGGHNDNNWGRIGVNNRARNYHYSSNNDIGDLFSFGKNETYQEIWTPAWFGTSMSYRWHTEVELEFREGFFDPPLHLPLDHLGWYGVSLKEAKKAEYRVSITINRG